MRPSEAIPSAHSGRASLRILALRYVILFTAQFLIAAGAFLLSAAAHDSAFAQEMAPGPQQPDAQSPAPPDSSSAQSPAPASASQSSAPASESEPAPLPFDPSIFQKPVPPDQLTFLNNFDGQLSSNVVDDKQFKKLLHTVLPDCLFHYGHDMSVSDAIETVLAGPALPVQIRDGRYVMVSGSSGPNVWGRGFLWVDMQTGIALGGFYFHPTNGEPTPTLTILSKQVKEKSLEMSQLPPAFAEDLNQWFGPAHISPVTIRYFITGNNEKILLAHDEDFCAPLPGAASPDEDMCEQMNADAADDDMTGAYYLEQTDHIPNATERTITGEDQIAWIQIRDTTCGSVVDPLGCHIRMTREHTRVIVHRGGAPHGPHH
jgi:uncharacterized protein YecT (DUF1311 family)